MFIAMNRFTIKNKYEQAFVSMWKERDSYLDEVEGFVSFHLLRGGDEEGATVYATHTMWSSEADFRNWVNSEQFKKAHQGQKPDPEFFAAPNKLELFAAVI